MLLCHNYLPLHFISDTEYGRWPINSGKWDNNGHQSLQCYCRNFIAVYLLPCDKIKKKLHYKCTHCSHWCTTVSLKTIWMYSRLSDRLISHIIKLLGFLLQALKASREQPFFYGTGSPSWSLAHWQGWSHDIICNHEVTKDHNGIYLSWQFFIL